jgi:methylated-DNA-[protein]-cysteine S-methyltransferase
MKRSSVVQSVDYLLFPAPLGWVAVVDGEAGLQRVSFSPEKGNLEGTLLRDWPHARLQESPRLKAARKELLEYLEGRRQSFGLSLDFRSLSPFQKAVYGELLRVPYGTTISYGALAEKLGRPRAARAVGRALAANPFPLVVPCHRVVAADGSLCGFSGGEGLLTKEKLLALERTRAL